MKIPILSQTSRQHGGVLIMVVFLCAIAAALLVSYLTITQRESYSVARSQAWNNSLALAEAGVEDAMALINKNVGFVGTLTNWSDTATLDGWSTFTDTNGVSVFSMTRSNLGGINSGYYTVYVTNAITGTTNTGPAILSIGYGTWNSVSSAVQAGPPVRKVFVQTAGISQTAGGIIAEQGIDFKGNQVTIDSWDSSTNTHSIWHTNYFYRKNNFSGGTHYGTWSNSLSYVSNNIPSRTAGVYVFLNTGTINAGGANIAGNIATGPGGTVSIKSGGYVGDLAWVFTSSGGVPGNAYQSIQPGHEKTDANKNFTSYNLSLNCLLPTNSWQTTAVGYLPVPQPTTPIQIGGIYSNIFGIWTNVGGTTYSYTGNGNNAGYHIGGGTYQLVITNRVENTNWVYYSVNSQLTSDIFIDAQYVVLYLVGGLKGANVTLNTNADVQIWTTGDIDVSGNAQINNLGNYTHAFSIFDIAGHPPVTVTLHGNAAETGYYYLPSSHMAFAGGGNYPADFTGAVFCYDISISGNMDFHFDESLVQSSPADHFVPVTWQEVQ